MQVSVTNTGGHTGKEVVQVYISCPASGQHKEFQQLAGFAKTRALAPGEKQQLEVAINLKYLANFREEDASYALDLGDYIVRLGNSSRNTHAVAVMQLEQQVLISTHTNICRQQRHFEDLVSAARVETDGRSDLPTYRIDFQAFEVRNYRSETEKCAHESRVDAMAAGLSRRELLDLVVGEDFMSMMFGKTYFHAPGAVGNTTSNLTDKGLINATLADGPAGLRLERRAALVKKNKLKSVDSQLELLEFMPKVLKRIIYADPEKHELMHQYTTAFPIALSLAQTWNTELIHQVGEAIGKEMHEYGIVFWLGPGMNLHRNPLCGRNYEYFSEDPLLSGKMAAAITRGCQSIGGVYATLKHFVANNQETNRNLSSSNMSERTLREIYLRGFEIAVRESNPGAIMSAYNKVNGVYTPNSHDLNTKVLRHEWGFSGVVMTDWFSTGKGYADNSECMTAGNDLIMPGGNYYKKQLLHGLKSGVITDEDLLRCARNIIKAILNSQLASEYPP